MCPYIPTAVAWGGIGVPAPEAQPCQCDLIRRVREDTLRNTQGSHATWIYQQGIEDAAQAVEAQVVGYTDRQAVVGRTDAVAAIRALVKGER